MAQLAPGTIVGSYRIEAVAGRGGMGVVYRATQLRLNRPVALKVIADDLAEDAGFRERFGHESQMAASIDHPNVIPVYEAGEQDGLLYLSMRYVEGTDLKALIRGGGRLPAARAAHIIAQVAEALDAAHARGLVHRDIKPANILIADGDRTFLTDFGLTKHAASASGLTKTGTWVGTADYVAPEQVQGHAVDARTDVYSLGCVLYETLTGQVPFARPSEIAKIYAHLQEEPPPVDWAAIGVPAAMDAVVRRGMAKDPAARYQSAGDLGRAALAAAEDRPVLEPERTVAAGAAAPGDGTTVMAASPLPAPPPAPATATGATQPLPQQAPPPPPSATPPPVPPAYPPQAPQQQAYPPPRRRSGARVPLIVLGVLVLLAGAGVGIAAATGAFNTSTNTVTTQVTSGSAPTGTTAGAPAAGVHPRAVRRVLARYAAAYSAEDSSALDALFAPNFTRHAPPKADMNRAQAVTEYDRQFAQLTNPTYSLSNVTIQTAAQGATASADYEIVADNATPATGTIAFSMVRVGGRLLIDGIDIRTH